MKKSVDTTYSYGQKLLLTSKNHLTFPKEAYVVSKTEGDYLVKLSIHFPYEPSVHEHFFVHLSKLRKHFRKAENGIQTELFSNCKKRTMADDWRERYLKTA